MYMSRLIEKQAEDAFKLRMQDLESAIVLRLGRYEDILFGVAGLFSAKGHVTPEQFDIYGDTLFMKERFPALDVINYAQYVTKSEKEGFVRAFEKDTDVRGKGLSLEPRDEHMVITRVYPASLSIVIGVDVLSNVGRMIAIADNGSQMRTPNAESYLQNKAYSSGLPVLTRAKKRKVLAARLGVYREGKLLGSSGIGFEIAAFFEEAVPEKLAHKLQYVMSSIGRDNGVRFSKPVTIFDSTENGMGLNLKRYKPDELLKGAFEIQFGGAVFRVNVMAPREINTYEQHLPAAVLVIGVLFFTGISIVVRRIMSDNNALDEAVNERTIELQCEINRRKSLEMELAAVIESERNRIGRELHDDLGQRLTGISLTAEIIAKKLKPIHTQLARQVNAIGSAAHEAMHQMRALAHGLIPVSGDKQGLMAALDNLATSTSKSSVINCTFEFDAPVEIEDESVAAHLYRIAQEALNNAIRHSSASSVEIRLDEIDGKIALSITDNGHGFDMKRNAGGVGLSTIAHRAAVIGYGLQIITAPEKGTTIKVSEC